MNAVNFILLGCVSMALQGCFGNLQPGPILSQDCECIDNMCYDYKVERLAKASWRGSEAAFNCVEGHVCNFREGYIDGYVAVAKGKSVCTPALPPKKYWSSHYSGPEGKKKMVAWFDGYQHGVTAALSDGMQGGRQIVSSSDLYNNCKQQVVFNPDEHIPQPATVDLIPPPYEQMPLAPSSAGSPQTLEPLPAPTQAYE